MTATDDSRRTFADYPLAELGEDHTATPLRAQPPRQGAPDPNEPTDAIELYGHCTGFCAFDFPTHGVSVREHGPWCESAVVMVVGGHDGEGDHVNVTATLAERYYQGTYHRAAILDHRREGGRFVALGVASTDNGYEDRLVVYVTLGEVRRLAAGLLRAADARPPGR